MHIFPTLLHTNNQEQLLGHEIRRCHGLSPLSPLSFYLYQRLACYNIIEHEIT